MRFTIHTGLLAGPAKRIGSSCFLLLGALPSAAASPSDGCAGQKVTDSIAPVSGNFGWALALEGARAVIGAPRAKIEGAGFVPGAGFVFESVGARWIQTQRLLPGAAQDNDHVGEAVALNGERVLLGASNTNVNGLTHSGAAYVFERQGSDWVETWTLLPNDPDTGDQFGISVAVDGDTAVVGAHQETQGGNASGAVYVFEYDGTAWTQVQKLASSDLGPGHWFGRSVAIEGEWIVVGAINAPGAVPGTGAAYVFRKTPGGWVETDKLQSPTGLSGDKFGWGLSISDTRIVAGAPDHDSIVSTSGTAFLFEDDGAKWSYRHELKAPDPTSPASFGRSVALKYDQLLIGANGDPDGLVGSGSAYLFRHDGTGFTFSRKLRAPDANQGDRFGVAVALSGETALVGAYNDADACGGLPNCGGSAWFFECPAFARGTCFGSACPCGNDDPARGCERTGGKGAALAACGSGSVALDDASFLATGLAPWQPAILFRGTSLENGGAGLSFGDGLRCAGGELRRLGTRLPNIERSASWGPGLAILGGWQPGDRMHLQVLYRDPQGTLCGAGFNTTHALEASFGP